MPQAGFHLQLARDALDRWTAAPAAAPFDAADPANSRAFMHGAVAPDCGFYPGGPDGLSHLVHDSGSGRLVRTLLECARTAAQEAYAWGWLCHALADVVFHPLVNARAEALVAARSDHRRTAHGALRTAGHVSADRRQLVAHVRVEAGLDAWSLRHMPLERLRIYNTLATRDHALLAHAIQETYGVFMPIAVLTAAHRNVTRLTNLFVPFVTSVGRSARGERAGVSMWAPSRRMLADYCLGEHSPAHAFLVPVLPDRTLVADVARARHAFDRLYEQHVAERARSLPDYDLNTGRRAHHPVRATHIPDAAA